MRPGFYAATAFLLSACGRGEAFFLAPTSPSAVTPPVDACSLLVGPNPLDFGGVGYGHAAAKSVTFTDRGLVACHLSNLSIGGGSDPGFYVSVEQSQPSMTIQPGSSLAVTIGFTPQSDTSPFVRSGALLFSSDDPKLASGEVSLSATILGCSLNYAPASLDFGAPPPGEQAQLGITFFNDGGGSCTVAELALAAGSDPDFGFALDQPTSFTEAPGTTQTVVMIFEADTSEPPYTRTGQLQVTTPNGDFDIPLTGEIAHCALAIVPTALNFGNILLNASATDQILLFNDGGLDCDVSGIRLDPDSDPDFSIPGTQPTSITVPSGGQGAIAVTFDDLSGASEPFLRQGMLDLDTGDPTNPSAQVPLSAFVNTACQAASEWVYTIDEDTTFSKFDPQTLTFTDIGQLQCPGASGGPFSMAVDQSAVAWVEYIGQGGVSLFQVSTADASCQATSFAPSPDLAFTTFGMSFLFEPGSGLDTLFVALTDPGSTLATISFPDLQLTTIGPTNVGPGELAGTGDGQLWDFIPSGARTDGNAGAGALLAQLNPESGKVLASRTYDGIQQGGDYAMKFWGGAFWVFVGKSVEKIDRNTGAWSQVIPNSNRRIVGAGVSTCAPVQQP